MPSRLPSPRAQHDQTDVNPNSSDDVSTPSTAHQVDTPSAAHQVDAPSAAHQVDTPSAAHQVNVPAVNHQTSDPQLRRSARDADASQVSSSPKPEPRIAQPVVQQKPIVRNMSLLRLMPNDEYDSSFDSESPVIRAEVAASFENVPVHQAAVPPADAPSITTSASAAVDEPISTVSAQRAHAVSQDPDAPINEPIKVVPASEPATTMPLSARIPQLKLSSARDAMWLQSVGIHDDDTVTQLVKLCTPATASGQTLAQLLAMHVDGFNGSAVEQLRKYLSAKSEGFTYGEDVLNLLARALTPAPTA